MKKLTKSILALLAIGVLIYFFCIAIVFYEAPDIRKSRNEARWIVRYLSSTEFDLEKTKLKLNEDRQIQISDQWHQVVETPATAAFSDAIIKSDILSSGKRVVIYRDKRLRME